MFSSDVLESLEDAQTIIEQKENIIMFVQLYREKNSDELEARITKTFRLYTDLITKYQQLEVPLWTKEVEATFIGKLNDKGQAIENLLDNICDTDTNIHDHHLKMH